MGVTATCERWAEALSAIADDEDPGLPRDLVLAHASDCETCSAFAVSLGVTLAPTSTAPDLADLVVARNAARDRSPETRFVRVLLGLVAVIVIASAAPDLVTGEHDARHLGAFTVAFGAALLVAAWRPARARSILPVTLVLAAAIALTAILDVAQGSVPLINEAAHIPELASVGLVWLLATPPERWPGRRR